MEFISSVMEASFDPFCGSGRLSAKKVVGGRC